MILFCPDLQGHHLWTPHALADEHVCQASIIPYVHYGMYGLQLTRLHSIPE